LFGPLADWLEAFETSGAEAIAIRPELLRIQLAARAGGCIRGQHLAALVMKRSRHDARLPQRAQNFLRATLVAESDRGGAVRGNDTRKRRDLLEASPRVSMSS
jgi:hypothetical protein